MSLFEKLNYGGVPFGVRLMAAAQQMQAVENPNAPQTGIALLARYQQQAAEEKAAAAEFAKKKEMADRLADKVELSNPDLAEMLRADPNMVEHYIKGSITDTFESKRAERARGYQLEDRDFNAGLTREGWARQDQNMLSGRQHEMGMQEDRQAFEIQKEEAQRAHDKAVAEGNALNAKLIAEDFFMKTGEELNTTGTPPQPGPAQREPIDPATSQAVPVPSTQQNPEFAAWQRVFNDPALNSTEASLLSAAFRSALSSAVQSGKQPDKNLAMQAAAEVYQKIVDDRNNTITAQAAQTTAAQKEKEAQIKGRIETAGTAEKSITTAQGRETTGDSVLDAINDAEVAMKPENADFLPATGAGSWVSSFIGDSEYTGNARAIYNAINTVKANIGFDRLQEMRNASPTGGALGQVAVQELEMLQAVLGSLDPTDANFASNLSKVKDLYSKIQQRNSDYAEDIENLRKEPTPEMRAAFDELYGVDAHLKYTGQ